MVVRTHQPLFMGKMHGGLLDQPVQALGEGVHGLAGSHVDVQHQNLFRMAAG